MKNNTLSIARSEQLHKIGRELNLQVSKIPCGLNDTQIKQQQKQKDKILKYLKATMDDWDDWEWQLSHRLHTIDDLANLLQLTSKQLADMKQVSEHFRFAISPYYFSLIDFCSPEKNPIGMMSLPNINELSQTGIEDPSSEEFTNPSGKIVRRYPNRVIINITNCCASFCRHCQRKRIIGSHDCSISPTELDESIIYIQNNPEIHDVLITGGDALTLSDLQLQRLLSKLRKIKHVDIIRLGSRMPVNLPQRITESLVAILKQHAPIYINTQFNHPLEITPEAVKACQLLAENGIILGNQMVLLKGINNNKYTVQLLNEQLLKIRVRPYYMFHAKNVRGTIHFQTSITEGINILSHLWGNTSGLSIPRYIVSAPNGKGKIELTADTLLKRKNGIYELTTWENIPLSIPDTLN